MDANMNPHGLKVGSVAYDRFYDLPAIVADFQGPLICLTRPSGFSWRSRWVNVRPATAYERRQLRAIAKLHAQHQRGRAAPEQQSRPSASQHIDRIVRI